MKKIICFLSLSIFSGCALFDASNTEASYFVDHYYMKSFSNGLSLSKNLTPHKKNDIQNVLQPFFVNFFSKNFNKSEMQELNELFEDKRLNQIFIKQRNGEPLNKEEEDYVLNKLFNSFAFKKLASYRIQMKLMYEMSDFIEKIKNN